ncbi:MAG: thioredoxin domain-containing protein, partial [Flammeovirgaceae bacterium]|nr:thioredoxin domain-containing protein [Flammeovirgaceae bacterium]MDW8288023.1 thioredoxin domain-containing protein [Flammeovirgaceae bacterium]
MSTKSAKPNRLIDSKSPYLLQHAYNPVEWYPWGKEALDKAKTENKPILVSIGYAACHWCHVMEKESFENEQVASLMNRYFVCIKVDREERPDIDQIYMEAVQLMGQHGGWPLNVFLTPDTKPFYGGTYFPPQQWIAVLQHIARAYQQYQSEIEKSASELTAALQHSEVERYQMVFSETSFSLEKLKKMFSGLSAKFDAMDGGLKRAPKFPMPSIYEFLLRFHQLSGDSHALQHVLFTLDKMAAGGIYDHVGGGFARYSVDAQWFVPHFEKMLYDNAQLLNLYANAYRLTKHQSYRQIIEEIVDFLVRDLQAPAGGFYASLDADSEGVEGKFYTWTTEELQSLLNEDFPLFADYYG